MLMSVLMVSRRPFETLVCQLCNGCQARRITAGFSSFEMFTTCQDSFRNDCRDSIMSNLCHRCSGTGSPRGATTSRPVRELPLTASELQPWRQVFGAAPFDLGLYEYDNERYSKSFSTSMKVAIISGANVSSAMTWIAVTRCDAW